MSPSGKHFTRNTVEASAWCNKCGKSTPHRIDGVKKGPCLECIAKLDAKHDEPKPGVAKQENLF